MAEHSDKFCAYINIKLTKLTDKANLAEETTETRKTIGLFYAVVKLDYIFK